MRFLLSCLLILAMLTACTTAPTPTPPPPAAASVAAPAATTEAAATEAAPGVTEAALVAETAVQAATEPAPATPTAPEGKPVNGFKIVIELTAPDSQTIQTQVYFLDHFAVDLNQETSMPDVIYDLEDMSWLEMSSGEIVRFDQCLEWAAASAEVTRVSLETTQDQKLKEFVGSMLDPNFSVEEAEDGSLVVENSLVHYEIFPSAPLHPELLVRFYAYDRMNACRKAMTLRQFPPYTQLSVDQEMEARSIFPERMKVVINAPNGSMETSMSAAFEDLSAKEVNLLQPYLDFSR